MSTVLTDEKKLKQVKIAIWAAAIAIPVVVALLFQVKLEGFNLRYLPKVYATINGVTAVYLVMALVAIKRKKMEMHRKYIRMCLLFSLLFLVCYVAYHITSSETIFGDINHDGVLDVMEKSAVSSVRGIYLFLLATHILLSIVIVPIVLFTYLFAWTGKFEKHKKWTRFAWPMWFYVAVSGVIVYVMIAPYMLK